ncbi:MAG TPA: hypothetical protein VNG12_21670 [Acidimicrobiales bacterium]|nr:hypothetical protein [Acidimicrobiales bacterium]
MGAAGDRFDPLEIVLVALSRLGTDVEDSASEAIPFRGGDPMMAPWGSVDFGLLGFQRGLEVILR